MKLTNEEKARIFCQYYGSAYVYYDADGAEIYGTFDSNKNIGAVIEKTDCQLILIPLSEITDADCIEVAKIMRSPHAVFYLSDEKNMIESTKYFLIHGIIAVFSSNAYQIDRVFTYLRSKGYALPWQGQSLFTLGIATTKSK